MLRKTLEWRANTQPQLIKYEEVAKILDIKTIYHLGFDKLGMRLCCQCVLLCCAACLTLHIYMHARHHATQEYASVNLHLMYTGRPVVYCRIGAVNPFTADERLRALIYTIEDLTSRMTPDVETMVCAVTHKKKKEKSNLKRRSKESKDSIFVGFHSCASQTWVLDFAEYSMANSRADSKQISKQSMELLQDHYPERLGLSLSSAFLFLVVNVCHCSYFFFSVFQW